MRRHLTIIPLLMAAAWLVPTGVWAQSEGEPSDEATAVVAEDEKMSPEGAEERREDENLDARYRIWGQSLDVATFDVPAGGGVQRQSLYQQARVDVGVEFGSLALRLETDLFSGVLAGEPPPVVTEDFQPSGATPRRGAFSDVDNFIDPRNVYVAWRTIGELRLGIQTSNFGLGIVANDGVESKWELFNQEFGGDRGFRALFATKPAAAFSKNRVARNIFFAIGADAVYRDDNASFVEGDRAYQFISSLFYRDRDPSNPANSSFLGAYFAWRNQEDFDGDELRALAFDLAGRKSWETSDERFVVGLGAESALIVGETTRAFTQLGEPSTNVLGAGVATEATVRWQPTRLTFKLKSGYASGDADSDDDTLYRFRFDPNYNVGLVLFDHYIPAATRAGYANATDPTRSGIPPKGVEGLVSDGAVENALYLNPQILFGDPDELLTGVGVVWARADKPLADPFNTFSAGGEPVGVNGGEASRDLGFEVDVGARYRRQLVSQLQLEIKAEYGILFPGEAFDDAQGNAAAPQNLVRGRVGLLW